MPFSLKTSFSNLFNTGNEREHQPTTLLRQSQTVPSLQFHAQSGKIGPGSPVRLGNDPTRYILRHFLFLCSQFHKNILNKIILDHLDARITC